MNDIRHRRIQTTTEEAMLEDGRSCAAPYSVLSCWRRVCCTVLLLSSLGGC